MNAVKALRTLVFNRNHYYSVQDFCVAFFVLSVAIRFVVVLVDLPLGLSSFWLAQALVLFVLSQDGETRASRS